MKTSSQRRWAHQKDGKRGAAFLCESGPPRYLPPTIWRREERGEKTADLCDWSRLPPYPTVESETKGKAPDVPVAKRDPLPTPSLVGEKVDMMDKEDVSPRYFELGNEEMEVCGAVSVQGRGLRRKATSVRDLFLSASTLPDRLSVVCCLRRGDVPCHRHWGRET
jgi:hypothetical protein